MQIRIQQMIKLMVQRLFKELILLLTLSIIALVNHLINSLLIDHQLLSILLNSLLHCLQISHKLRFSYLISNFVKQFRSKESTTDPWDVDLTGNEGPRHGCSTHNIVQNSNTGWPWDRCIVQAFCGEEWRELLNKLNKDWFEQFFSEAVHAKFILTWLVVF